MKASRWVLASAGALMFASIAVWYATGREGYTRWPDARLAGADAPPSAAEGELLADVGFTDAGTAPAPEIRSRFALGLVPGGFDPPHLLSVATTAVVAVAASIGAVLFGRMRAPRPAALPAHNAFPVENTR